jgi:hypothetical protein
MYKITFQNLLHFFYRSLTNSISSRNAFGKLFLTLLVFVLSSNGIPEWNKNNGKNFKSWTWEIIKENQPVFTGDFSHWSARAGLQALNHNEKFYIFGGRTPLPGPPGNSIIHGDGWVSEDKGKTWTNILPSNPPFPQSETHWSNRAYFQALEKGSYMYIIGGQNFGFPESDFFNDVWRSRNGSDWTQMTDPSTSDQRWAGRAGLSAVAFKKAIYVMGGSFNDDPAVIGGPPTRVYFNDVWKSTDNGVNWTLVTDAAPWAKRAGGIAVVKDGYMYMIGGEEGFTCPFDPSFPPTQQPPCLDPPYFNDVWRTKDGENWELVTDDAGWEKRPGHQVVVAQDRLVLFGGFGLGPDNGISPANPSDVWVSNKGKVWKKVNDAPWNANGSKDVKYDFDALVVKGNGKSQDEIYTFGGDRETFNFGDPENYKNVDNDVWKFSLPYNSEPEVENNSLAFILHQNYPNPFTTSTKIAYEIAHSGHVSIKVYDQFGRPVTTLISAYKEPGQYEVSWNGNKANGKPVKRGIYYAEFSFPGVSKTITMYLTN